ncbi:MAG: NAD-dependent epimerase/dehydratase family protein [Planctomycetota bacterium]|jgi:nucleoside-diphosphate-sugar epimerase
MPDLSFVTGANGFLGSNLVRALLRAGFRVRGLVRATSDLSFLEGVDLETVTGDLADGDALRRGAEGAEVLFHVAALASDWGPRRDFIRANVAGTANALAAAASAGVRRFVHISSASVHGFSGYRGRVEDDPTPPSPFHYVETKRMAEELVRRQEHTEAVVVRPGNVYGPRDRVTSLPMLKAMRTGWMGTLDGGRRLTCPTYVENLVDAVLLAAASPRAAGRTYLVTDGLDITWREWLEELATALGVPAPRLTLRAGLARRIAAGLESVYLAAGSRAAPPLTRYRVANGGTDYHFSIARAREELGFAPRVGLSEACRTTAEWFRSAT